LNATKDRDLHARRLLLVLVVLAVLLSGWLVKPFWVALFLAAVLTAALRRWMEWLSRRLRGRRALAAGLLTVGVLVALVVPVAALGTVLVTEAIDGIQWIRNALQSEGVWGLLSRLPGPVEDLAHRAVAALGDPQRQLQQLAGQGGQAAAAVGGVLAATGTFLLQATMMLVALFFFLVDGQRLVAWVDAHVPLRAGQFLSLLEEFRRTSLSVLVATAATAGIQTLAALAGYLIARAPNPVFLSVLTLVVALIPAAGATLMVLAIAVLQLVTGHVVSGIFLAIWGGVVVSLVDNVARPYLLKGGMELHGGVVFFALIGGLAVFGGVGLILGPLVATFLVTVLNMYRREFGKPPDADGTEDAAGAPPPAA
jgi:predicted PurR-regulated permease PerM